MSIHRLTRWTARLTLGVLVSIALPFAAASVPAHAAQQGPVLDIEKTHTGDFVRGQEGEYTITVTNTGEGATNGGLITVTENVPAGLELVQMTGGPGSGWMCGGNSCVSQVVYGPGEPLPVISVIVNVLPDAPDNVINEATVSGGGSPPDADQDPTVITGEVAEPDLSITKTHAGNFTQGGTGTYTMTVSNAAGAGATEGTVTVTDILPAGVTPTAASGAGWECGISGQTVTCTRSDPLAAGAGYSPITVTVAVSAGAPCTFTNTATVSGGGSESATANDPTTVTGGTCNGGNGGNGGGGSILPVNVNGLFTMFNNISTSNNINSPGAGNSTSQTFLQTAN
ncbi:hypothetical protein ACTMTU_02565 [Streptomyces sp. OZ13]|uniref:hypothetical protein n=1 Tax=Streptomyces sp. OZ13 TaxID=3452210 RepID=UPI003F8B5F35